MSELWSRFLKLTVIERGVIYVQSLERRDQTALLLLAIFFLSLFVYGGIWQPVNRYHEDSLADRDAMVSLLAYMRTTEKDARSATSGDASGLSGQSLLTRVSSTAQRYGIKPNRLQPEGDDAVSVWFEGVAFNDLVRWLQFLEKDSGVVVRQLSVDRQADSGRVNARIVIRS